jgi:energy-converting hydrogenase Eha subunit G
MVLATFRLTRLFVYDKITFFIRDALYHVKEEYTEEGVTYFLKKERVEGPMLTAYELLTCPWCFSMWAATFVAFFYFFTPLAWLPICILAISGVASLVQIITNMIGWAAENGKIKATTKS